MKKFLIPTFLLFSILISSYRFPQSFQQKQLLLPQSDTLMSMLALYGQYVFFREDCDNCHYVSQEKQRFSYLPQISLDGVGGKYSEQWHYFHLHDPRSVSPYSEMPAYPDLFSQEADTSLLITLIKNARREGMKYPDKVEKSAFKDFRTQQNAMVQRLKEGKIEESGNEITALIAFLQQIPLSPEKRKQDSIVTAKIEADWIVVMQSQEKEVMRNALSKNKDTLMMGQSLYQSYCGICHGTNGEGGIGPNLTDEYWLHGGKVADILHTIHFGVPEKGMISWKRMLTPIEIAQITAYIGSILGSNPPDAKAPQGEK